MNSIPEELKFEPRPVGSTTHYELIGNGIPKDLYQDLANKIKLKKINDCR